MLMPCMNALSVPAMVLFDIGLHSIHVTKIDATGYALVVLGILLILVPKGDRKHKKTSVPFDKLASPHCSEG